MANSVTGPDGGVPGGSPSGGSGVPAAIAVAQLIGGLYDSHQDRKAAKRNTDKTIEANKREAELAYQRQIEMWNLQNAYNDPRAQMARFRAAGLSPHLMYGQGNPGNASAPPAYQPPNIQYKYAAGSYGAALQSVIPTLMAVGTWMQDMRLQESELERRQGDITLKRLNAARVKQLVDHLAEKNPRLLRQLDKSLVLQDYQADAMRVTMDKNVQSMINQDAKMNAEYGSDFMKRYSDFNPIVHSGDASGFGGLVGEKLVQAKAKTAQELAETKIKEAKASWTDMNITDPQALIMLVMQGVLGLAGAHIRSPHGPKGVRIQPKHPKSNREIPNTPYKD